MYFSGATCPPVALAKEEAEEKSERAGLKANFFAFNPFFAKQKIFVIERSEIENKVDKHLAILEFEG